MCAAEGIPPGEIDVQKLRAGLLKAGAYLGQ